MVLAHASLVTKPQRHPKTAKTEETSTNGPQQMKSMGWFSFSPLHLQPHTMSSLPPVAASTPLMQPTLKRRARPTPRPDHGHPYRLKIFFEFLALKVSLSVLGRSRES